MTTAIRCGYGATDGGFGITDEGDLDEKAFFSYVDEHVIQELEGMGIESGSSV